MAAAQTLARGAAVPSSRSALVRSPETVRLYAADWSDFVMWCRLREWRALPADPATIAAYLQSATDTLSVGALSRRLAAIADQHRQHGEPLPTRDPSVRAVLRAARSTATPKRHPPPTAAQLLRRAAACPGDLAGLRDRTLLLLLAAGGIGRTALVGLDAEQAHFDNTGVTLQLHDRPDGVLRSVRLARSSDRRLCPARVLEDWQRASDTRYGPLFRKIDRWGNLEHNRLGTDAIRRILAHRSKRARQPRARTGAAAAAKPA